MPPPKTSQQPLAFYDKRLGVDKDSTRAAKTSGGYDSGARHFPLDFIGLIWEYFPKLKGLLMRWSNPNTRFSTSPLPES